MGHVSVMGTKRHYELLDGLRGVAALMVLTFHCFEGIMYGTGAQDMAMTTDGAGWERESSSSGGWCVCILW
ncbi:MAG: hypothetical protein J6Y06_00485 [Bacteroidales bacterium]|nr:hypothetical protein [Bacteroidales bacterium]